MRSITYSFLLTTLNDTIPEILTKLPGEENTEARKEVMDAVEATLAAARAGLEGDKTVQTASKLNKDLAKQLDEIYERHEKKPIPPTAVRRSTRARKPTAKTAANEEAVVEKPAAKKAPAKKKAEKKSDPAQADRVLHSTNAGVKKPKKEPRKSPSPVPQNLEYTAQEKEAAEALLQLATSKPAPLKAPIPLKKVRFVNSAERTITAGPTPSIAAPPSSVSLPFWPAIKALDPSAPPQENFLAGVQYALQCVPENLTNKAVFSTHLLGHVKHQLSTQCARVVEKQVSEDSAAAALHGLVKGAEK